VPHATCVVDRAASDGLEALGVTITLRGGIPPSAQTFRWRYDLTFASYALTTGSSEPQTAQTIWLDADEESRPIAFARSAASPSHAAVARGYFELGFTHILPKGVDHILFVLGIFLLSRRLGPILWQVSAFTLAHSLTLGLTLYGLIALPASIVEPLIALSIVYVGVENLVTSELKPWRVALVFGFGLLHGMGFAGVLGDLALPRSEFLTGLVAFNAGVEAGQLTVILAAFLVVGYWARQQGSYRRLIVVPGSAAIALTGMFWTMQRLAM
jgi:hydrogenase/urease accessory protein HupE